MSVDPPQAFRLLRFGDFELRERTAELRRKGLVIPLPEQAFQVLRLLLGASGELVPREELQRELWPDRSHGDFEGGLNAAVRKLRRALGDDGAEPHLVGTLPRRGYRLLVPVEVQKDEGIPPGRPRNVPPPLGWLDGLTDLLLRRGGWLTLVLLVITTATVVFLVQRGRVTGPRFHTIAVLPLANLSGEASQEYLAAGLTEQLIHELALRPGLRVAPLAAVHALGQDRSTPSELCHRLGVEALVEGAVLRAGGQVQLNLRLVPAEAGLSSWARRIEVPWKDLGSLQAEAVDALAEALASSGPPKGILPTSRDGEAVAAYLEARYEVASCQLPGVKRALELYGKAIARDPDYAAAHAGLATASLWRGLLDKEASAHWFVAAHRHAIRALELRPGSSEAHLALASIQWLHNWDFEGAETSFRKALEIAPDSGQVHAAFASYLFARGRMKEGDSHLLAAQSQGKDDPVVALDILRCFTFARRYENVLDHGRKLLAMRPQWSMVQGHIFEANLALGRSQQACDADLAVASEMPMLAKSIEASCRNGNLKQALRREAEWNEQRQAKGEPTESYGVVAYLWAALGERERALRWLEWAIDARDYDALFVLRFPYWDGFRGDPRFEKLLARMGLDRDPRA